MLQPKLTELTVALADPKVHPAYSCRAYVTLFDYIHSTGAASRVQYGLWPN